MNLNDGPTIPPLMPTIARRRNRSSAPASRLAARRSRFGPKCSRPCSAPIEPDRRSIRCRDCRCRVDPRQLYCAARRQAALSHRQVATIFVARVQRTSRLSSKGPNYYWQQRLVFQAVDHRNIVRPTPARLEVSHQALPIAPRTGFQYRKPSIF